MGYEPIKLLGERVWRTYLGGREIDRIHGKSEPVDSHFPEEWMYSVTRASNAGREELVEGICRVDDGSGTTLKELIEANPKEMLGEAHVRKWGNTPGVLIKIIDSMERLTVQVHPDKKMAEMLFNSRFGKTECWYVLDVRKDCGTLPCIYLGFKEGITKEKWRECFDRQDYDGMLSLLNRIGVKPGEVYLVKGGIPHAIGAGCMIIEIQEPTDYTIRVEKVTPSGYEIKDSMCHQGLGFEKMFDCFCYEGTTTEKTKNQYCIRAEVLEEGRAERRRLVGYGDTDCFGIDRLEITEPYSCEGRNQFSCLYILSGNGILKTETKEYQIRQNDQFFVPAETGKFSVCSADGTTVSLLEMYGPSSS